MIRLQTPMGLMLLAGLSLASASGEANDRSVDYLRDIKPILKERCYACHGALQEKARLRIDTAQTLLRGGRSGPAVVSGRSEESLLIERVTAADEGRRMPPEGEPLTAQQIGLLRRWIDQGAALPAHEEPEPDPRAHWAFQAPTRPSLPPVQSAWVRNPIDAFLAAEHERLGLQPVPPAVKDVLLRRLYLDLVGLPPTRDQWQAFLRDASADAYEQVVERLLNSPAYGQRWGRHWMDVWRYSDWSGENKNLVRGSPKHIWHWRDWIVASLNEDKGYDRMILEMLAGDELAPGDPDVVRATGFLARNYYEFNRNVWLNDTVEHTAKAFLGLTLNCARCHDHKFDPLLQREYYAWRAIFEPHDVRTDPVGGQPDTTLDGHPRVYDGRPETPTYLFLRGEETQPDKARPVAPAVPAVLSGSFEIRPVSLPLKVYYPAVRPEARQEMLHRAESAVSSAQAALSTARSAAKPAEAAVLLAERRLAAAQAELAALQARVAAERVKFAAVLRSELGEAEVGAADRYEDLAAVAAAADRLAALRKAELAMLQGEQKLASARRLAESGKDGKKAKTDVSAAEKDLQKTRKELTAAQAARKRTDARYAPLGPQAPPTSTGRRLALARWLTEPRNPLTARVAVNHVWLRHFGEPLVDAVDDFGRRTARPRHAALLDWLAVEFVESGWSLKHLHRLIVTSSAYRLASATRNVPAGNLKLDPENRFLWRMNSRRAEAEVIRDSILHVAGNLDCSLGGPEIPLDQGETSPRRSLYFRHAHERQVAFLEVFDGADVLECYRRSVTVVPQQALALANSALPYEQSRRLARQLTEENLEATDAAFVRLAFAHLLTRSPTAAELDRCLGFLKDQGTELPSPPASGGEGSGVRGETPVAGSAPSPPTPLPRSGGEGSKAEPTAADPVLVGVRASLIHALMNHNDFITIR